MVMVGEGGKMAKSVLLLCPKSFDTYSFVSVLDFTYQF